MLKMTAVHDAIALHPYLIHPNVYPFVRHKAENLDEYVFLMKRLIEENENGTLIIRTIVDEHAKPIGQIGLFDLHEDYGFLGTWLGVPYHGKGYNRRAKEQFFREVFETTDKETIYMKVRKVNVKSQKALLKMPYVDMVENPMHPVYQWVNREEAVYDVFSVQKETFELWLPTSLEA